MALHRLSSITIGVPNPAETIAYYLEFGLRSGTDGWLATTDGGDQLRVVAAPTRRLIEVRIGADDHDDLAAATFRLNAMDSPTLLSADHLVVHDLATGVRAVVQIEGRLTQEPRAGTPYNGPGRYDRVGTRAPGILRPDHVQPRKLDHAAALSACPTMTAGSTRKANWPS